MQQADVIAFFDALAPTWDAHMVRDEAKIHAILTAAGVTSGVRVLDIACGTGVLFADYLACGAAGVVGVDISPAMAKIAAEKADGIPGGRVRVLCGDVQTMPLPEVFDCAVLYNAYPHFATPDRLFARLAGCLAPGGRFTVAHGMSRAALTAHHGGSARAVSRPLPAATELAALLAPWFRVDTLCEDEEKYIVSGTLLAPVLRAKSRLRRLRPETALRCTSDEGTPPAGDEGGKSFRGHPVSPQ